MLVIKTKEVDMFVSGGNNNQYSVNLDKNFTESLMNFEPLRCHRKKRSKLVKIKNSKVINETSAFDEDLSKKQKFSLRKQMVNRINSQ